MAHFVAPAQFVAGDEMCTFNSTFCRTLHTLSPQIDNMCSRSRHILSPLREHGTMLPRVWCIASVLRQAFPNWPCKLYCILIKEIVDSWNYLFIIYLPEDIINAPTLDTFKARLNKCWSGRKFICTKLDRSTKQLKSQHKGYLEGNENTESTERPWCLHIVVIVM